MTSSPFQFVLGIFLTSSLLLVPVQIAFAQPLPTWAPFAYAGPYLDISGMGNLSDERRREYYKISKSTIQPTALDACKAAYVANNQFYFGKQPNPFKHKVERSQSELYCWIKDLDNPIPEPWGWMGYFGPYHGNKPFDGICVNPAFVLMQLDLRAEGEDVYYNWQRKYRSELPSDVAKGPWYDPNTDQCSCPAGAVLHASHQFCIGATLQLAMTGLAETRPAGTGGTSTITFTAKTTTPNGQPKAGVALSFSADVKPKSGGHDHHSTERPKGSLSPTQGVTNANGETVITFTAPEFAGIHTIKATCPSCSNKEVSREIQVKVPDLLPISPNPPQNDDGTYAYALTSVDKTHQGNGRYHVNQYYLTRSSHVNLQSLIASFSAEGWGTVALNDASLYWGGRYDIKSNWDGFHRGHREGREIDISFARAGNRISSSKQNIYYDKFCKGKKTSFPFSILHHYVENAHFHVYLEKQTACWKSEK